MADSIPKGGVGVFGRDLRPLGVEGQEVLQALGLSKAAIEGKTPSEVFPPETRVQIEPVYRAVLGGSSVILEVPCYNRIYLVQAVPLKNGNGKIHAGMVKIGRASCRERV